MKKLGLLLVMAIMQISAFANADFRSEWHGMNDPVEVTVRGIKFFVFPNGEFDFNAHQIRNRRHHYGSYGVRVERDRDGKIRRVGNVYFNYNQYGQVTRMGNLFIKYNRRGMVRSIGHKYLRYSRGGYMVTRHRHYGYSTYYPAYTWNSSYYYGPASGYSTTYSSGYYDDDYYDDYYDDTTDNSDGDYYYRPSAKKNKKKRKTVRSRR